MKDVATSTHQPSTRQRQSVTQADPNYVSLSQTRALLASSFAGRQRRLEAADMMTTDQAATHVGTSRVTINAWIAKGRAIGLTQTKRGFKLPQWQFEPALWPVIPELSRAIGTTDGWALLAFLESPHGALDGATPRQMLEQGQRERVLEIAANEGH